MIETSYYGNFRNLEGRKCYAISQTTPSWFQGSWLVEFAPPWWLLENYRNGQVSIDQYAIEYNKHLDSTCPDNLLKAIVEVLDKEDAVLLGYESPDRFCHRHLLTGRIKLLCPGIEIHEWGNSKEVTND